MAFKVESQGEHFGFRCVTIFTDTGHRCGYVGVEKDNPFYDKDYDEDTGYGKLLFKMRKSKVDKISPINILCWDGKAVKPVMLFNVHGGITFSGKSYLYPVPHTWIWWFGFDCAHLGDGKDFNRVEEYFPGKGEQVRKLYSVFNEDPVKSLEYVKNECESLAKQIMEYTNLLKEGFKNE